MFRRIFLVTKPEDYKIYNKPGFLYRQHPKSKTGEDKTNDKKFLKDRTELCLQGLGYVKSLKETELTNFFLWQAVDYLEQSRFVSKKLYDYILTTIYSVSDHNRKFEMLLKILRLNYYLGLPKIMKGKIYSEMVRNFKYDAGS